MIANFAMPAGVSNVRRPFDQRLISHVPANAPRRVPIATEPNSKGDRPAMTQGEKDPTKIAGPIVVAAQQDQREREAGWWP